MEVLLVQYGSVHILRIQEKWWHWEKLKMRDFLKNLSISLYIYWVENKKTDTFQIYLNKNEIIQFPRLI